MPQRNAPDHDDTVASPQAAEKLKKELHQPNETPLATPQASAKDNPSPSDGVFLNSATEPVGIDTTDKKSVHTSYTADFQGKHGTAPIFLHTFPDALPTDETPHSPKYTEDSFKLTSAQPEQNKTDIPSSSLDTPNQAHASPPPKNLSSLPLPTLPPSIAQNTFTLMSYAAPLFIILLLALQIGTGMLFPSLYFAPETTIVHVFKQMLSNGFWLTPFANETLVLPGYYWFLYLIALIPAPKSIFLPIAAGTSALLMLWGTVFLGKSIGFNKQISFSATLILLTSFAFVPLTHWIGPELLVASLTAFALACLYRAWNQEFALFWAIMGCIFTTLATLVGGIFALCIPLIASPILLLWRGNLRRLHRADAVLGFGVMLTCILGWVEAVILFGGEKAQILKPIMDQMLSPFIQMAWPPYSTWHPILNLSLCLFPWALLPLFAAWGEVFSSIWNAIKATRDQNSGPAWLWICLSGGVLLLIIGQQKHILSISLLLPMAALILAKTLVFLSPSRSKAFYTLIAFVFAIFGLALISTAVPFAKVRLGENLLPLLPATLNTLAVVIVNAGYSLPILGGACLINAGFLFKFVQRSFPCGALTVLTLLIIILAQFATLLIVPSLKDHLNTDPWGRGLLPTLIMPNSPPMPEQEKTIEMPESAPLLPTTSPNDISQPSLSETTPTTESSKAGPPETKEHIPTPSVDSDVSPSTPLPTDNLLAPEAASPVAPELTPSVPSEQERQLPMPDKTEPLI